MPGRARGLTVVIEAFTTGVFAMVNGVKNIYSVLTIDEAWELRRRHPD